MKHQEPALGGHNGPPPGGPAYTDAETAATVLDTSFLHSDAPAAGARPVFEAPAPVEKGAVLLGTYRVESPAITGGMGRVWRVCHTGWNLPLAMKQPKMTHFRSEQQRGDFVRECEAWINLGLHPHVVSCYYVRDIGGIPSIFSEWMEGGSLKKQLADETLYIGSDRDVALRILDIAIRCARGLHYIHERRDEQGNLLGLIHQDVKPGNLLLTAEGDAKVADFGVAHAYSMLPAAAADATIVSQRGAYTAAYCSPEQLDGQVLTRRTDIYSWALTVLEMFMGERGWKRGPDPSAARDRYLKGKLRVPIPATAGELLWQCLDENPERRPHDFGRIDDALTQTYAACTGRAYPRGAAQNAASTADTLNNVALSFLDLGKSRQAEQSWKQALEKTDGHAEALYNSLLYAIRHGKLSPCDAADEFATRNTGVLTTHMEAALQAEEATLRVGFQPAFEWTKGRGHTAGRVVHSPDGRYLLRDRDSRIEVSELHTGKPVYVFENCRPVRGENRWDDGYPWFSETGRLILLKTDAPEWILADADGGNQITFKVRYRSRRSYIHEDGRLGGEKISCVTLSRDGNLALSCGPDFAAVLWNAKTGKPIRAYFSLDQPDPTLLPHNSPYNYTGFWEEENAVYAIQGRTEGQTVLVWDMATSQLLASCVVPHNSPHPLADVRPLELVRNEPAPYLLSSVRQTEALNHLARLHESLIDEATRCHRAGDTAAAHDAITRSLSLPGYERRTQDIQLFQAIHAHCKKTGLHSILRHTAPNAHSEAEQPPGVGAPKTFPHIPFAPLQEKAAAEAEQMLNDYRHWLARMHPEFIRESIDGGRYQALVLDTTVSRDGKRAVIGVATQGEFSFNENPMYTKSVRFGALVYDTESGALLAKLEHLESDTLYRQLFDSGHPLWGSGNTYESICCPFSLHLDSTGDRLLVAAKELWIHNLSTGATHKLLPGRRIRYARFLSDDRLVFFFAEDGTAGVLRAADGKEWNQIQFKDAPREILSLSLLSDDAFLIKKPLGVRETWLLYWQYALDQPPR